MWITKEMVFKIGMGNCIASICALLLLAALAVVLITGTLELDPRETAQEHRQAVQEHVDALVECLVYFKDPRTEKCFADVSDCTLDSNVGLRGTEDTLTGVDCDKIPPGLLVTARIKPAVSAVADSK
jgi:hypothetical protein